MFGLKRRPPPPTLSSFAVDMAHAMLQARATKALAKAPAAAVETATHVRRTGSNRQDAWLLHGAAALLGGSVFADSGVEHYRGDFQNRAMFLPLIVSACSIAASLHGATTRKHGSHRMRDAAYAAAGLTGIVGTGFHLYNVTKEPGGLSWLNLFYSAPIGAPAALSLSGMMGFMAERVREAPAGTEPQLLGLRTSRVLAALTGLGLFGTVGEAGLLHFRGAFHNPAMLLPVTMPPVAAALMLEAAVSPPRKRHRWSRIWLAVTAILGVGGVGFHAYGVSRAMGGWKNWRQNVVDGPPLPAPPSFAGLALGGLAALRLIERHRR
ncbi:hypothetical protein SAMN05216548_101100 [Faunimonas pinastri]|uniref:Uncharacterized protein n=1 Tax=Faunimonas pinastri TaxID=1855383 RepID=A0A1H8ZB77_9HYPH|nr:hypothetical protein [Faunimonas pinastri]SEP61662.1 hypothetical protein SAMN05216548_101100 [Faunimonas pinastri]